MNFISIKGELGFGESEIRHTGQLFFLLARRFYCETDIAKSESIFQQ